MIATSCATRPRPAATRSRSLDHAGSTRAVARGRRWARATATTVFVLATAVSLFDLLVGEYGATLLPASLGLLGVLPCVAGAVAVVQLWRRPATGGGRGSGR